jgi:predicted MFS family arabinose efflux permease
MIYMGNAVATAFAAPIGAYVGGVVGWRFVFAALVPLVLVNLVWQVRSLPTMPPRAAIPVTRLFALLKRRNVAFGMVAVMLAFAGSYGTFTYFRPFLETVTGVEANELSLLLLGLGVAGFAGTRFAGAMLQNNRLYALLRWLPFALAGATLGLMLFGYTFWGAVVMMIGWGAVNAAIPVTWSTWLAREINDEPESGGGLMVGSIQMAIMLGGALGGELLDHIGVSAPLMGGVVLLTLSAVVVGNGDRLKKVAKGQENP